MRIRFNSTSRILRCAALAVVLSTAGALAQTEPDLRQIMLRLDRLEEQNRALLAEIRQLRSELAASSLHPAEETTGSQPGLDERLQVEETRTADLAQSKVEAAHHFPIRLTGMALFNAFLNSHGSAGGQYPTFAAPDSDPSGGASFRQSIIGLDFDGPHALGDGKISGTLRLDLFGGSGQGLDQLVRLRTATLGIDWKSRGFLVGVDKPIISPREPDSIAQVGVSPLSGAGNLWLWIPQARFHQNFQLGELTGFQFQAGVVQTRENSGSPLSPYTDPKGAADFESARPGVEARLEFFSGSNRRIEIAGGFHHSVSHVAYISVPSDVYSVDWLARPWKLIEFTGSFFTGQNVAPLGTGGIRQGLVILGPNQAQAVHSLGGWGQLTIRPLPRFWCNLFTGQQDDRNSNLPAGSIGKNLAFGANVFYRIAPNVLASFEAAQTRADYISSGMLRNNHYDLGLAYLF